MSEDLNKSIDSKEIEIDLISIVRKLIFNKNKILRVSALFALFGILVAIMSPKEYVSSYTMVPQIGDNGKKMGGFAGLAAMAGIGLNDNSGSDVLSPTIYPQILESVTFKKDLMYTKVKFKELPYEISLYEYFTNSDYRSFNMITFIKKYTLGLPSLLIRSFNTKNSVNAIKEKSNLIEFTAKENYVAEILSKRLTLSVNEKEGSLMLSVSMPEAEASTEVVEKAKVLLQKYITNFKIDKVKQNLEFITDSYNTAKKEYLSKQIALANFQDANRNMIMASSKTIQERLSNDYAISFNVYSDLAKQLEQAKIKVKDETPVLTVIKPAFVPIKSTKPRRLLTIFGFMVFGLFFSSTWVLLKDLKFKNILVGQNG